MTWYDEGIFLFAMPGSGKSTAIKILQQMRFEAFDGDFGDYRKHMVVDRDGLSADEVTELEHQFYYRTLKQWAHDGAFIACNEPAIAEKAAKDGYKVRFVLPKNVLTIARLANMRTPSDPFGQEYLRQCQQWLSDWTSVGVSLSRRFANVSVRFYSLPTEMLRACLQFMNDVNYHG